MSDNLWSRLKTDDLFMRAFNAYNKSIGNSLTMLNEQPQRIQGRQDEIEMLYAVLERPSTPVALLLGQAGVGKTALVEEFAKQLNSGEYRTSLHYKYLLVSLRIGSLGSIGTSRLQSALSSLLDDLKKIETLAQESLSDRSVRIVLFIDEVHMLVTIFGPGTKIGGDVIKDVLARSPIRVIAATTRREYDSTIAVDKPLAERFKQIEMKELDSKIVFDIVSEWWSKVAPDCVPPSSELIKTMIDANKMYRSDSAEPRKSLDILEDLVSYSRRTGKRAEFAQLDKIFRDRYSINLSFHVDPEEVYSEIERRVKGQPYALHQLRRMIRSMTFQLDAVSNRPMLTALFTGPTGVGKALPNGTLIPVCDKRRRVPIESLKPGDFVRGPDGKPSMVKGVYPQGKKQLARLIVDGHQPILCSKDHLLAYQSYKMMYLGSRNYYVDSLEEIVRKGLYQPEDKTAGNRKPMPRFFIDNNSAVEYPHADLPLDPYAVGALIGDGCIATHGKGGPVRISSTDEYVVARVADALGTTYSGPGPDRRSPSPENGYTWSFECSERVKRSNPTRRWMSCKESPLRYLPEITRYSHEKRIPDAYKTASIEQRFELLRGLFDTDGGVTTYDGRAYVGYTSVSRQLIVDIAEILSSLGYKVDTFGLDVPQQEKIKGEAMHQYHLKVLASHEDKLKLLSLERKRSKIVKQIESIQKRGKKLRKRRYDSCAIQSIEILDQYEECTCIEVDNDSHTFIGGTQYVVTHNTETTKCIADSLYPGEDVLLSINMPDYKTPEHEASFRRRLGEHLRHSPNAIILLDELEKAHDTILDALLVILDEGLVTFDTINREGVAEVNTVSLRNSIVIATTNAGSEVFANDARFSQREARGRDELDDVSAAEVEQLYKSLIQFLQSAGFKPEMLGRFNRIVPYRGLSSDTLLKIAENELESLKHKLLVHKGITVEYSEPQQWPEDVYNFYTTDVALYVAFIKAKADDPNSGGARAVKREINANVYDPLVDAIIDNPDCTHFKVSVSKTAPIYVFGAAASEGGVVVEPVQA